MSQPASLRFGRFELIPAQRELRCDGAPLSLGARAFDLLVVLAERRDQVVSKQALLDAVWPSLVVEENNLQVQVSTLRKLLGPAAIATVPGRGYRLVVEVQAAGSADAAPRQADAARGASAAAAAAATPQASGAAAEVVAAAAPTAASPAPVGVALAGRVPAEPGELLGRADELARLAAALASQPLTTLLGPGGVGKTRLALAAVHRLAEPPADGLAWIDLSPLPAGAEADAVARAVAACLGLPMGSGVVAATDALAAALAPLQLLLVLDNAEHLAPGLAQLVVALLAQAPRLRLLVTSQRALHVQQEQLLPLGSLALPDDDMPLALALQQGALALLVQRARRFNPRFTLDQAALPTAVAICRTLDGLALALELAAARISWLGLQAVHDRLAQRFQLLTEPRREGTGHQHTLRAAMDWSHTLLTPEQQALLHALGVFHGGFTLALAEDLAATALAQDSWVLMDTLGALVDTCWVQVDEGSPPRYRLLDSARLYALEHLAAKGQHAALQQAHAQTMARLADRHFDSYLHHRVDLWLGEFLPEAANLSAALDQAVAASDLALALRLFPATTFVLNLTDRQQDMARRARELAALLAAPAGLALAVEQRLPLLSALLLAHTLTAPAAAWAVAAEAQALLASQAEQTQQAAPARHGEAREDLGAFVQTQVLQLMAVAGRLDEAEALRAEIQRSPAASLPLLRMNLASIGLMLRLYQGRVDEAIALGRQAIAIGESLGASRSTAMLHANVCACLLKLERFEEVAAQVPPLLARMQGLRWTSARAVALCNLLHAQVALGRWDQAWATAAQGLAPTRRSGYLSLFLTHVAELAVADGQPATAAALIGRAGAMEAAGQAQAQPDVLLLRERVRSTLRQALGEQPLAAALTSGAALGDLELDALVCAAAQAGDAAALNSLSPSGQSFS